MRKGLVSVMLLLALSVTSLVACGDKDDKDNTDAVVEYRSISETRDVRVGEAIYYWTWAPGGSESFSIKVDDPNICEAGIEGPGGGLYIKGLSEGTTIVNAEIMGDTFCITVNVTVPVGETAESATESAEEVVEDTTETDVEDLFVASEFRELKHEYDAQDLVQFYREAAVARYGVDVDTLYTERLGEDVLPIKAYNWYGCEVEITPTVLAWYGFNAPMDSNDYEDLLWLTDELSDSGDNKVKVDLFIYPYEESERGYMETQLILDSAEISKRICDKCRENPDFMEGFCERFIVYREDLVNYSDNGGGDEIDWLEAYLMRCYAPWYFDCGGVEGNIDAYEGWFESDVDGNGIQDAGVDLESFRKDTLYIRFVPYEAGKRLMEDWGAEEPEAIKGYFLPFG